jgi:hypothetical protein
MVGKRTTVRANTLCRKRFNGVQINMPRVKHDLKTKVETRLSSRDIDRLAKVALARKMTKSEVIREAVLWYLDNHNEPKQEREVARAIRNMTDRVCGMLARQGTQLGTLFELTWQSHSENQLEQRFHSAVNTAKQSMRKRLAEDERVISESMKKVVGQ